MKGCDIFCFSKFLGAQVYTFNIDNSPAHGYSHLIDVRPCYYFCDISQISHSLGSMGSSRKSEALTLTLASVGGTQLLFDGVLFGTSSVVRNSEANIEGVLEV